MTNLTNAMLLAAGLAVSGAANATCTTCGTTGGTTNNIGVNVDVPTNVTVTAPSNSSSAATGGRVDIGAGALSPTAKAEAQGGNVETGAVDNNISYNSVTKYKAAANSAYSGSVIGSGHGCFEHQGGWGAGGQVFAAGASVTINSGEKYNIECPKDQAALAIINKTGNPVNDAIAAETAANMAPETVGKAVEKVASGQSRLVGLYATGGVAAPAAQSPVTTAPAAIIVPAPAGTSINGQLGGAAIGGQFPTPKVR